MAKERKTRSQKIRSDKRHSQHTPKHAQDVKEHTLLDLKTPSFAPSYTYAQQSMQSPSVQIISVSDYQYLLNDIRKISLVTGIIILVELGIYWTSNGF